MNNFLICAISSLTCVLSQAAYSVEITTDISTVRACVISDSTGCKNIPLVKRGNNLIYVDLSVYPSDNRLCLYDYMFIEPNSYATLFSWNANGRKNQKSSLLNENSFYSCNSSDYFYRTTQDISLGRHSLPTATTVEKITIGDNNRILQSQIGDNNQYTDNSRNTENNDNYIDHQTKVHEGGIVSNGDGNQIVSGNAVQGNQANSQISNEALELNPGDITTINGRSYVVTSDGSLVEIK